MQHVMETLGTMDEDAESDFAFCMVTETTPPGTVIYTSVHSEIPQQTPTTHLLLDNQATCNVFCNAAYLRNIHETDSTLFIHTNSGVRQTNMMGELPGYGQVWFYEQGIANILSLAKVKKQFRVTYDSWAGGSFIVHKPDGTQRVFRECAKGLHYLDMQAESTGVRDGVHGVEASESTGVANVTNDGGSDGYPGPNDVPPKRCWEADHLTKPLNARHFIAFRNAILHGHEVADVVPLPSRQECVGQPLT